MAIVDMRQAVGFCWLAFVIVWLLAAGRTKRTAERVANQAGYRVMWALAFGLMYVSRPGRANLGGLTAAVLPVNDLVVLLGLLLTIAGLALAFWARATLGGNWSGTIQFKENHELVQSGPYAFVRHPIYTAILMMFLGTAIANGTLGALIALPLAVASFIVKARQEEALMGKHFPDEYAAYRAHTRMIVPFVY
jgi:protein-S-isoprenylcysteine O-methyltransferase Ste14